MFSERVKVEIKAEDIPKDSVVSDTQFSISSLLRQQRQQALDTLNSLETQQKQLELSHEREMEDLKRENQRLRSENQALHSQIESSRSESAKPTASSAPPLDTLDTNTEALSNSTTRQFEHIAKYALDFDIRDNTTREIVLHDNPGRRTQDISLPQENQYWRYDDLGLSKFNCCQVSLVPKYGT
ncbi:hypothetical protein FSPOR_6378 [Fusarium sporotrichioides]|uniref:Uncharacterized protein n=1 Tax=Fusarium sporotrichioides TaxID=5514 RepID=A0A395S308_FUSSP|nr:hypothetical protein FSPOR_6378 [Fusarium sporotrichioides]